jgi:hypothetical protein
MFHIWHAGADCLRSAPPATVLGLDGRRSVVKAKVTAWFEAKDLGGRRQPSGASKGRSPQRGTRARPPASSLLRVATDVSGIVKGLFPFFWAVAKTA